MFRFRISYSILTSNSTLNVCISISGLELPDMNFNSKNYVHRKAARFIILKDVYVRRNSKNWTFDAKA